MQLFIITTLILLTSFNITHAQPSADDLLQSRMRTPLLQDDDTITGEGQCWHAAYNMDNFMNDYRRTNDITYLDAAVKYYNALIKRMHTSPDGYKGWVGPYIYDKEFICDVHIGDAILINPMLDFSETVLKHDGLEIKNAYQNKANEYLQLAKKHLIEKWHERGTWHEDGPYGAYKAWDQYMTAGDLTAWRPLPARRSNLTLPFNKQNSMGIACLRIYRITGDERYRDEALKIFNYLKSRFCLYKNHYIWNYWEPFGEWDLKPGSTHELRHWVNVHPYRNYQAGEVHEIAEAYQSGITFDKTDIERIINTNINVMWIGDQENPKWRNSNYAVEVAALGEPSIKEPPGGHFSELAGTLWTGLADFSQTARELSGKAYDSPVRFERKYDALPVTVLDRPFNSTKNFIMAAAMPSHFNAGETTNIVCQTRVKGTIVIELYSADGKMKIAGIRKQDQEDNARILIHQWDTDDIQPGEYLIRWTLNGEYREFPIHIN